MPKFAPSLKPPGAGPMLCGLFASVARFFGPLLIIALVGCSPPVELQRPQAPVDAAAASLLPPGRIAAISFPEANDGASATIEGGGSITALRFPSADAAQVGFTKYALRLAARPEFTSRSSVSFGTVRYIRYSGQAISAIAWVSSVWVFCAEAGDEGRVYALIEASKVGGVGTSSQNHLLSLFPWLFVGALVVVLVLIYLLIWFVVKRLAIAPDPRVPVLPREELMRRLFALNDVSVPYLVRQGPEADIVVEWKFADATWWGVLAKSGLRNTYRLRLYVDDRSHCVYALDQFGEVDWSAGVLTAPKVHFRSTFFRGIVLKRYERGTAYGFQTPSGSGFGKVLDYTFDIDTVKGPVIDVVTLAGWTYQPTLWPKRRKSPMGQIGSVE